MCESPQGSKVGATHTGITRFFIYISSGFCCLPAFCCSCVQVRFYSSIKAAASCPCDCALRLIHLYSHCKHAQQNQEFESLDFVSVTVRWAVGRGDDYYTLVSTLKFAADLHFILTFLLFCVVFLITSLSSSLSVIGAGSRAHFESCDLILM